MDYRTAMELCQKTVDGHADRWVRAQELADLTGYSLYHFCHVFRAYFGLSVGAYVRARALDRAAADILAGKSVTDAALDCGFDTPAGFSKAFKKQFGVSAVRYRQTERSRIGMEPKIVQKEAFSAVGCEIQPQNGEQVDVLESGAYWSGADCGSYAKIHESGTGKGEIGAWMHPDGVSGELRYFFGAVSGGGAPEGFVKLDVPAARYAVFDVPPVSAESHGGEALAREVRKTWKYIFKEWMDRSVWRFDERGMCFEFYRGRTTQIFVPVKAKE